MRSWVLAAGLLAAAATTGAKAADLDEGPPPDRYGSAYDDPRYADIYKYPRAPQGVPPPGVYGGPYSGPYAAGPPPYAGPIPRERVYREEDDYDRGYAPSPRRYSYVEPAPPPYAGGRCAPRELVKEQLYRDGWRDFHDGDPRGAFATVRARRPNGRLFELTLERCSGQVVRAEPLEGRAFGPYAAPGPYANGPAPRRWDRAY